MIIKEVIKRKPKASSKESLMKEKKIKESQLFIEEWHDTCLELPDYEDVWFIADNRLCVGKYEPLQQMFCMADGMGVELRYVRQWKYVGINKQIAVFPKEKQIIAVQTPDYPCLVTGIFTDHCIDDATGDEVSAVITDETVYEYEDIIDWKRVSYWYELPEMPIVILEPVGDAITIAIPDSQEVIVDRMGVTDNELTTDICNCEGDACECVGPMSMDSEGVKSAIVNSNNLSENCNKSLKEGLENEEMEEDTVVPSVGEDSDVYDIDAPETEGEEVQEDPPESEKEYNPVEEVRDEDSELQSSVKGWYTTAFQVDNLSDEISEDVTFRDIMDCLEEHRDFYDCIGVADSVIRERVFQKLAEILNVEPMVVYYQWLKDDYDWYADVEEEEPSVEEEVVEEETSAEEFDPELKEEYDSLKEPISLDDLPKDLAESTMRYFCNILKESN